LRLGCWKAWDVEPVGEEDDCVVEGAAGRVDRERD